ncbi:hypothetical protein CR205_02680 [Alteribacter lacisalsi]|uniref:Bacterial Ig-like domain-containing protein n=1 Tax=Alteribacter lacisalsi TaxID=2045244 RepID=A0A2W0HKY5_9BACI|nr:immunoglobulin-like domain-containing protein [Alteribacter lacisalsi]PYZ97519.1 hypothetical protein CR205_02680 [Alteribacter lacisalsi]
MKRSLLPGLWSFIIILLAACGADGGQDLTEETSEFGDLPEVIGNPIDIDGDGADERVNVKLSTDVHQFDAGETLVLYTKNAGPEDITAEHAYSLEKKMDNEWIKVELSRGTAEESIVTLEAGESFGQEIDLPDDLPAGMYRFVKIVQDDYPLAALFDINE